MFLLGAGTATPSAERIVTATRKNTMKKQQEEDEKTTRIAAVIDIRTKTTEVVSFAAKMRKKGISKHN